MSKLIHFPNQKWHDLYSHFAQLLWAQGNPLCNSGSGNLIIKLWHDGAIFFKFIYINIKMLHVDKIIPSHYLLLKFLNILSFLWMGCIYSSWLDTSSIQRSFSCFPNLSTWQSVPPCRRLRYTLSFPFDLGIYFFASESAWGSDFSSGNFYSKVSGSMEIVAFLGRVDPERGFNSIP